MKKLITTISLLIAAAMALCQLAGCQNSVHPAVDYEPATPSGTSVSPADTAAPVSDPSPADPDAGEPAPVSEKILPSEIKHESVMSKVSDKIMGDDIDACAVTLTAVDESGNTLWTYTTPLCLPTELETVQYIGMMNGLVYVNEQAIYNPDRGEFDDFAGHLLALDAYTGEPVWENDDFRGASVSYAFDGQTGILYICGFYGPDCFAVDAQGNTLWKVSQVDESMWWPYELRLQDDGIEILFDGTDSGDGPVYGYIGYDGTVFAG